MAATTLLRLFDEHWNGWRRGVETCRESLRRATVHDLRVNSRRLLSFLELSRGIIPVPRKADERATAAVESLLDTLGPLRDAQNQRNRAMRTRPGPGVEPLRRHLKQRESRFARRARHGLGDADRARVRKAVTRLRKAVAAHRAAGGPAERRLRLAKVVDLAAADVRNRLARLDLDKPRTAHRLRLALKRFRYTVEIATRLSSTLDIDGQPTVRALQRRLGRAHDAEVLVDRLDRFVRRHPGDDGPGLAAFRQTIDAERARQFAGLTRALTPLRRMLTGVAARATSRPRTVIEGTSKG